MPTQNNVRTAAVIGSGFGGLALAIRLQARGVQTTIYEKRDKPGGRAYYYEDKEFRFDAGPTVITAPHCLDELFVLAGKRMRDYVELVNVEPFYRLFWEDGDVLDYSGDHEKFVERIRLYSEKDASGYKQYLAYAEEVFHEGYEKLSHVPFLHFWDMVRVSPELLRLKAYRSVYSTVSRYVRNDHLRQALSFNSLLIGGNPFRASSIYSLIHPLEKKWGVWFPRGGMAAMVAALVQLFKDIGGRIVLDAPVEQITTAQGRVDGVRVGGEAIRHDMVASNADVTFTYNQLLNETPQLRGRARRLARKVHSPSLFLIYFGCNRRFEGIAHHNIMFANRYKELLTDIFDNGVLAEDFSIYLHAPCKSDPSLAPEGHEAFYALTPVPHLGKLQVDWSRVGPTYADRIIEYLDRNYLPGLKDSVVTRRIFSPEDFATELNAHQGSAFSLEPQLTQSAWFRVHNADPKVRGLYFVGAGTHPGAGIPGVVGSAKATASVIGRLEGIGMDEVDINAIGERWRQQLQAAQS